MRDDDDDMLMENKRSVAIFYGAIMPIQGRGNVQRAKYGWRVRVRVRYRDWYGPYHNTMEAAQEDLSKMLGKDRSPKEK